MSYKYKVKCSKISEYDSIKNYLDDIGIKFKQKEGKSLKVDCNLNELRTYLQRLNIWPLSIKPCGEQKNKVSITGYRTHNKLNGMGWETDYDLIDEINNSLPMNGIHSADDIKEYEAMMRLKDPSGLMRAVFERDSRSFTGNERGEKYNGPTTLGGVDWRYEKGGEFYDDYEY